MIKGAPIRLPTPLITIGITCFNAEETVRRAVLSAVHQTWANFEIIVVDDRSTDSSWIVLEALRVTHPELRLIRHEANRGYPSALNTIVGAAKGEFISFFDDDDESHPERLIRQWERLNKYQRRHPAHSVFCYCNREVVPAGEDMPTAITLAIGRTDPEPHGIAVSDFLLSLIEAPPFVWGQFGSCTLMTRCAALKALGGFDEAFRRCAEWDMAVRAGFSGAHFIAVDEPLVRQHLTAGFGAEKSGKAPLRYALALRHKHSDYLKRQGIYASALAQAYARYHYARGEQWRSRLYTIIACSLSPTRLLPKFLAQRRRARVTACRAQA